MGRERLSSPRHRARWGVCLTIVVLIAVPAVRFPAHAASAQLRIGYMTWVGAGPLFLARDERFFDEAGVSVHLTNIPDPKLRFAALAAGTLDGLVTTLDTLSLYWQPTFPSQAVLGLDDSRGADGIVAKRSIHTIKDLRGRQVAVDEGGVSQFFLGVLLRQHRMTERDIKPVDLRPDDAGAAFLKGKVAAAVTWQPWLARVTAAKAGHVLVDSSTTPGVIVDVLVIRRDVIVARPAAVRAVVHGWYRAVNYRARHAAASDALMARAMGGWLKDPRAFEAMTRGIRYYNAAVNRAYMAPGGRLYVTVRQAIGIWSALGRITAKESPADLLDPSFVR